MCKRGDIILIRNYKDGDITLRQHSFVVLDDSGGQVSGVDYDLIALVMSSFKDEAQRERKLRYPGNFAISASDEQMGIQAHGKDGYIKAEQFYYFQKDSLDYIQIGSLTIEAWDALLAFIEMLSERGIEIRQILDNLRSEDSEVAEKEEDRD